VIFFGGQQSVLVLLLVNEEEWIFKTTLFILFVLLG